MTRKSKARYGLKRTYKINPTVKALRSALFLGLATAAAAPAAQAGTCVRVVNQVVCAGDFDQQTLDSWNELAVVDPFDPAIVELDANVTVYAEMAVDAWNIDNLTLINDGNLISESGWYNTGSMAALYAESSDGSVDFTNNGWIISNKGDTLISNYGASTGAVLDAKYGVTAVNNGLIAGTSYDESDDAFGLSVRNRDYGDVSITNNASGDILARSNWDSNATGLRADNWDGDITVVNDGRVAAEADWWAVGIQAEASDDVTISVGATGEVDVNGWAATGIRASGGNFSAIAVNNSGNIEATGQYAEGISLYGDFRSAVDVDNYGNILVEGFGRATGVNINGNGIDVGIDNFDVIAAYGGNNGNIGVYIDGMNAGPTGYGSIVLNNRGVISAGDKYSNPSGNVSYGDSTGVFAVSGGDITISNVGSYGSPAGIIADTQSGSAAGIWAASYSGDISIQNGDSSSKYSIVGAVSDSDYGSLFGGRVAGIYAETGNGAIGIGNNGIVFAGNGNYGDAIGIGANASGGGMFMPLAVYAAPGDIDVTNDGLVYASALNGNAFGIDANSDYGDISVINNGAVWADANNGFATGIDADTDAFGSVTIGNTGEVRAEGDYGSTGVSAFTRYGAISISNAAQFDSYGNVVMGTGLITAQTYNSGSATGVWAYLESDNADTDLSVYNGEGAFIGASSPNGNATGVWAYNDGNGDNLITNNGTIDVYAGGSYGDAVGVWAIGSGDGLVSVNNNGAIVVEADGNSGNAIGIYAEVMGGSYGDISVVSGGTGLIAGMTDGNDGDAFGIKTVMYGTGTTTVTNYGDIAGIYGEGLYGDDNAWGIHSQSSGGDISITNAAGGFVYIYADEENGTGIQANAGTGDIAIANNGIIDVYGNWYAYGIVANAGNGTIDVTNAGRIDVYADGDYAFGVKAAGYGDITVGNTGVIDVYADNDGAVGVYANAGGYGDVMVTNTGSFDSYGSFVGGVIVVDSYGWNAGIEAHAGYGDVTVGNSGLVDVVSRDGDSNGVWTTTNGGANTVTNTGVIVADSNADYGTAWGIDAESGAGAIDVNNNGGVVVAMAEYAWGIEASSGDGDIDVNNSGDVYAFGGDDAYGIDARSFGAGDVTVTNSGYVLAEAGVDYASGIYASTWNGSGDVSVTNTASGAVISIGSDDATGIAAWADVGTSTVVNSGDAYAYSHGWTVGIAAQSNSNSVSVTNSLAGNAEAGSDVGQAYGISVWSGYGALVSNAGYVGAYSETGTATGIYADAWNNANITVTNAATGDVVAGTFSGEAVGMDLFSNGGNILVTNNGDVQATSNYGSVTGISAYSDYGDITVNGSTGNVTAISSNGSATGIYAEAGNWNSFGDVSVTSGGLITARGTSAVGIYAYNNGYGDVSVTNSAAGRIVVTASNGEATGISAQADSGWYGDANVLNSGSITVTSNGDWGDAYGMYVESDWAGSIGITSTGSITVTANGYNGDAFGVYAQHEDYGDVVITSGSTITVNANGDYGDAFGISAVSYSDSSISISNTGSVRANANGYGGDAFGIYSESFGDDTSIGNSGNIRATSADGNAWAVYHRGGDVAITNAASGNIFGVIQTAYGDDTFTNSGDWYATEGDNKYSDFAGGDDSVVNNTGARIFMEDSWIDMGSASQYGSNSFLNNGKIFIDGKYNVIDMGTSDSVFTNNGASLHFEDGAADDQLIIFGDFAGSGHIVVDADGTSMLADRLYIDGDVLTNTANVIDVFMNEYPSLQDMIDGEEIDVVHVSGTSTAANFNLGDVTVAEDSLFTVDVTLNKHINYSGSNDLFALGFEISGLSQSGVAVSSIAPAVQNLWHLGVGTVFQRQGSSRDGKQGTGNNGMMSGFKDFSNSAMQVADYQGASGVWLRAFTEDGNVSPDASRNFGMGGGQGFDLKNTGLEFGAGYAFNDQWTAGLLGGTSESTLRPDIGGRAKVNADTFGGYVTYTPGNGFYADFSYRSMDFDGNGNGGGDDFRFEGNADGYSLEVGYGFKTASGLIVEPQFQYSKMDISLDTLDYTQGDFELTDGDSSQMRAGVALRKTFQAGSGDWTPYASLSFINETDASNNYLIGGILTGNVDTSGNSTLVEAGATAHYGNMVFSGGVNWKDGGAYDSLFGGQVSVRFTW
ncbi:hypothetical protein GCM10010960_16150 [Arenimonas maotaiensis]|uniref:Autotransporter domain-containing protein n=1 Tax=Arenimonas maotaiensis TaxID=1446479 RepID=A0A917FN86_9GAMM|nr:hypothetical protein [Arenimonas maotaiensis]GGF95236.1 hypothetical protein GCM10010960_16150 [Arenimonas maotaiensis]